MRRVRIVNIAMVYLLAVVVIALRFSRGPRDTSAVCAWRRFDFLFVPPQGTFTVNDVQYLLTFAIMLAVALVISGLMEAGAQAAAQAALAVEAETERIRSTLLASISHDLRTPLAVMTGASSSLAEAESGSAGPSATRWRRASTSQARETVGTGDQGAADDAARDRRARARARLGLIAEIVGERCWRACRAPVRAPRDRGDFPRTCRWCAWTRR